MAKGRTDADAARKKQKRIEAKTKKRKEHRENIIDLKQAAIDMAKEAEENKKKVPLRTLTPDAVATHLVDTLGQDAHIRVSERGKSLVRHLLATWVLTAQACQEKGLLAKAPEQAYEQANSPLPAELRPITPFDAYQVFEKHESMDDAVAELLTLVEDFLEATIKWLETSKPGKMLLEELCRHWRDAVRTQSQQWAQAL